MAKYSLRPPRRRARRYSTVSTPHHTFHNQLAKLDSITQPHQVWCSDLTRIEYHRTVWYLATIEDVATRQIIAHQIGKDHDSQLVLLLLKQAFTTGVQPTIFHSDQGTEFMAQRCTDYLEERGVHISVSDVAAPWQNGYCESFFGRFKEEFGDPDRFEIPGTFIEAVYHHIHYYNHDRIHTALKMPPATYAAKVLSGTCFQK